MPDIIQLLPDFVANQIAAGEVIQRPSSAVKELLENAVDSGANEIKLIIKEAGKSLIQVIDNGCGMSETDARMCFERHATSKIREANDLFAIKTLGFRGEALASIAAIAQVELKTKKKDEQTGTSIIIEGSQIKDQLSCACPQGTSFIVKNLFFNVPARRSFLKSNAVEINHIIEEFLRVALAYPHIGFSMYNNNDDVYILQPGTLKQRLSTVYGNTFAQKIVPVEQNTAIISMYGFVGKPEFAKKTRGEQFLFVNDRYFKHPYLNHAIENAYEELLPAKTYPSYFVNFRIDPQTIDVNIHPTKTEIKFQDEKMIYPLLRSAVKHAIGKHSLTPSIDFEVEQSINNIGPLKKGETVLPPKISINPDYNPFAEGKKTESKNSNLLNHTNKKNWEQLYEADKEVKQNDHIEISGTSLNKRTYLADWDNEKKCGEKQAVFQLKCSYILSQVKSGLLVIDQQRASERILFERYLKMSENSKSFCQQLLFPQTIKFPPSESILLKEIISMLNSFGFDIAEFGSDTFVVNGIPSDMLNENLQHAIENILSNYKQDLPKDKPEKKNHIAIAMAKNSAVKAGKQLQMEEMNALIDSLFACQNPQFTPNGKPIYTIVEMAEMEKRLK
jgi:DNA mismatch repair protein MutL